MSDDEEVIRCVLGGGVSAFRVLVERYQGPVFRFLGNLLSEAADREDVAQEVFLAAYCNLAGYRSDTAGFLTWLLTIARNKCLNLLQKRRPRQVAELPEVADRRTPDAVLAEEELFRALDAALDALPLAQKSAFVLAEFEQLSYEEIARIEGAPVGTIKSRVARARDRLRGQFQPKEEPTS